MARLPGMTGQRKRELQVGVILKTASYSPKVMLRRYAQVAQGFGIADAGTEQ
ncbi:hypothetical protein CT19431_MP30308 [Cupriavidus taiwanensis]|nr:hypothetical protein CT19431_MP30308 [Cupriavidus taiwanensis]